MYPDGNITDIFRFDEYREGQERLSKFQMLIKSKIFSQQILWLFSALPAFSAIAFCLLAILWLHEYLQ
jgi:hypothetical protein